MGVQKKIQDKLYDRIENFHRDLKRMKKILNVPRLYDQYRKKFTEQEK